MDKSDPCEWSMLTDDDGETFLHGCSAPDRTGQYKVRDIGQVWEASFIDDGYHAVLHTGSLCKCLERCEQHATESR